MHLDIIFSIINFTEFIKNSTKSSKLNDNIFRIKTCFCFDNIQKNQNPNSCTNTRCFYSNNNEFWRHHRRSDLLKATISTGSSVSSATNMWSFTIISSKISRKFWQMMTSSLRNLKFRQPSLILDMMLDVTLKKLIGNHEMIKSSLKESSPLRVEKLGIFAEMQVIEVISMRYPDVASGTVLGHLQCCSSRQHLYGIFSLFMVSSKVRGNFCESNFDHFLFLIFCVFWLRSCRWIVKIFIAFVHKFSIIKVFIIT